jgi:KipI family sensor histidine kinase inhibitor
MQPEAFPRIRLAADQAVIVEFGDVIDEAINRRVIGLDDDLADCPIAGVVESIPTYRSLFVRYDPVCIRRAALIEELQQRIASSRASNKKGRLWTVPALYGGQAGQDLDEVARVHDLTTAEVIALHCGARYRVFMIGFMPGYAYLGGLPKALHTPRLSNPRPLTAAGGLAIGGAQASISSVQSPSGWHFLGRTPVKMFDPHREQPIIMHAGDEVRFERITPAEAEKFDRISAAGGVPADCEVLT